MSFSFMGRLQPLARPVRVVRRHHAAGRWSGLALVRSEESAADKVLDAEHGHNGRPEGKEAGNQAVKGSEIKVH